MPENQFVEITYGDLVLTAPAEPRKNRRQQFVDWLVFLRSTIINSVVIGSIVAVLAVTAIELLRRPVIIEEIGLPRKLSDMGYSGSVAAHRLWDAVQTIQDNSGTLKPQTSLMTASRQLDVVEPGTGISLQGLTQMLRELLGLKQTRIAGEIICLDSDCASRSLALRLRVITDQGMQIVSAGEIGGQSVDEYFIASALKLLEKIDPYVVAAYYYDNPADREKSLQIARQLVDIDHKHAAWGANMIANMEYRNGNIDASVRWYETSTALANSHGMHGFALPWYGWGVSLGRLERHKEAIEKFERAATENPELASVWLGWGASLAKLGQHEQAIGKYEKATQLDSGLASAWLGWGVSLARLGQLEDAKGKYQHWTEIVSGGNIPSKTEGLELGRKMLFRDIL
ncbi:Tetratricopeptide repeat protein [Roseovarius litorisediminis]|uniref:Tetratricopeptide repeat protein n=1 Tax=Roseovarius litorisediminis TaxID=1312363 RepID=A0A1Y5T7V5_9RHOB|nr:tetratricopeptide repeat protein [Roseovarius litorisediminis]SLN57843.1 Tetratricopeptide repeat protein [Roseovarius litorisediminis]